MSDDIDTGGAAVVLDLEAELILFRCSLARRDPSEHPALQEKCTKRLWGKIFQISEGWSSSSIRRPDPPRPRPEKPPMPERLAEEVAKIPSARQAAIHLLACASVAVSGRATGQEAEVNRLRRNVVRYLETPEGARSKSAGQSEPCWGPQGGRT